MRKVYILPLPVLYSDGIAYQWTPLDVEIAGALNFISVRIVLFAENSHALEDISEDRVPRFIRGFLT